MANKRIKKKLQNRENVPRETIYRGSRKQAIARYNRREARRKLNAERRRKKEERQIQKAKEAENRRTERKTRVEQEKQFEREQLAEQRVELPAAAPPEPITQESQKKSQEREAQKPEEQKTALDRRQQSQEVAKFESVARHVVNEFIASFKYYPKGIYELVTYRINAMRKQYGNTAVYQMIMEFPQTLDDYMNAGVYENSEDATNAYLSDMLNYLPGLTYEERESLESYFEMTENGESYAI